MLVLSRKKNESVLIDGDIRIEVLSVKGNQVRLGIVAPRKTRVLRGELAAFEETADSDGFGTEPGGAMAVRETPLQPYFEYSMVTVGS